MAEKIPEGVPRATVVLGGEERTLVYTLGVSIRLERETGRSTAEVFDRVQRGFLGDAAYLLWAMAAREEPGLSPEAFADSVTVDQVNQLGAMIGELVGASQPEAEDGPEGEAKARRTKKKAG